MSSIEKGNIYPEGKDSFPILIRIQNDKKKVTYKI